MTIQTAEEFMSNVGTTTSPVSGLETYLRADFKDGLIKFARLHVKAALKEASFMAKIETYQYTECSECGNSDVYIDEQSILNSYPDERIQ